MKIKIIAIGKIKPGPEQSLIDDYLKRLPWKSEIIEIEIKKSAQTAELRKKQEAEKIIAAIPPSAAIVVLDEHGKSLTSRNLAQKIDHFAIQGKSTIAFIIGGPDGLDPSITKKASITLALGTLTWPHKLARVMLTEQIYRAWSITTNHPYHRD